MGEGKRRVVRTGAVGAEEKLAVAGDDGVEEGAAVLGGLGRGFAVVVLPSSVGWYGGKGEGGTYHVGGPVVYQEGEVVSGLRR